MTNFLVTLKNVRCYAWAEAESKSKGHRNVYDLRVFQGHVLHTTKQTLSIICVME